MVNRYFIRSGKNWEFMEIPEEEAQKQQFVVWLEDLPGEFWAVRGYYREEE